MSPLAMIAIVFMSILFVVTPQNTGQEKIEGLQKVIRDLNHNQCLLEYIETQCFLESMWKSDIIKNMRNFSEQMLKFKFIKEDSREKEIEFRQRVSHPSTLLPIVEQKPTAVENLQKQMYSTSDVEGLRLIENILGFGNLFEVLRGDMFYCIHLEEDLKSKNTGDAVFWQHYGHTIKPLIEITRRLFVAKLLFVFLINYSESLNEVTGNHSELSDYFRSISPSILNAINDFLQFLNYWWIWNDELIALISIQS